MQRDYLDEEDVWNQFGYWILHLNSDPVLRSNVDHENKHDPNEYAGYLSLLARVKRIDAAHHGNSPQISAEDLKQFYREEVTILGDAPRP